jgi:hypothetical protein
LAPARAGSTQRQKGDNPMNLVLWVLQILLGVYFFVTGILHFIVPPGLPAPMAWMYELPQPLHWHMPRGEVQNIVMNLFLAALAGFVAYGRWKLSPLRDRAAA